MHLAKKLQANLQVEYCFIMAMPDPIQPEQPRREFKKYRENFLNIRLTAGTCLLVAYICLVRYKNDLGGKCFADEQVQSEVQTWLRQKSKDFYVAGFDALVKR
jgi:hypothetical protein